MNADVARVEPEALNAFFREHERESLKTLYEFAVVWHERSYGFAVRDHDRVIAAGTLRVAASLGHVDQLVVADERRRRGLGKAILASMAEVANYYNCHKMTAMVPHLRPAQLFFEACDYTVEAVLPQHTFKLDVSVMRRFLL